VQKMKMRGVMKSMTAWRGFVMRKISIRNMMHKVMQRVQSMKLSRVLCGWYAAASRAITVRALAAKRLLRRNETVVFECLTSMRGVVQKSKLADKMIRRCRYRYAVSVFHSWSVLVVHEAAERQRLADMQADHDAINKAAEERIAVSSSEASQLSSEFATLQAENVSASAKYRTEIATAHVAAQRSASELSEAEIFHALACKELMEDSAAAFTTLETEMEQKLASTYREHGQEQERVRSIFETELAESSKQREEQREEFEAQIESERLKRAELLKRMTALHASLSPKPQPELEPELEPEP
jgi:hypothetical protein